MKQHYYLIPPNLKLTTLSNTRDIHISEETIISKFGEDIRRISRYQELLDKIRQLESGIEQLPKAAITGIRSIAYTSSSAAAVTGTPGVTKPDDNGVDTNPTDDKGEEDGEDKLDKDGQNVTDSSTSAALDSLDNSERDGWYDLDSILQGAKDGLGKVPPTNNDVINTITGASTAAGRQMVIHLRPAETSFIGNASTPDGENSFYSEVDPDWDQDYYYTALNFTGSVDGPTFDMAGEALANAMIGYHLPAIPGSVIDRVDYVGSIHGPFPSSGDYQIEYYYSVGATQTGPIANNIAVTVHDCSAPGNPSPSCLIVGPNIATWTDMLATQLAWVEALTPTLTPIPYDYVGRFVPHPYDVNVPTEYEEGASILDLVTENGSDARIGPLANGGFYAYYSDGAGAPTGDANAASVYIINPNKTPGGYITPTALSKMLPPE